MTAPRRAAADNQFGRTIAFTIAGTAAPGLGLIAAKRHLAGGVILGVFVTALLIVGSWAAVDLEGLLSVAVRPSVLNTLTVALGTSHFAVFATSSIVFPRSVTSSVSALKRAPLHAPHVTSTSGMK